MSDNACCDKGSCLLCFIDPERGGMKTRAAIIKESPGNFVVEELHLDEPRQGELTVRMVAAGLCHSDDHIQVGDLFLEHYPMVAGHEGAGIVEAVGPNTPGWEVGDHVVLSFIPSCGLCRWCVEGQTYLCDLGAHILRGSRHNDPNSFRFSLNDEPVGQLSGLGTFSEYTVVPTLAAIKVDKDLSLETLVLLGCGVGTGWGAAVHSADIRPGDVAIVMGVGGIGINAVQGAKHAGATTVIAVDPVAMKRDMALKLGATHAFASIAEADEFAKSCTNGQGADASVVTVGVTRSSHIEQAFWATRKGGTIVITGTAGANDTEGLSLTAWDISMTNKRIQGSLFGECNPKIDIPRQIAMYRAGQLKLDELVTTKYSLDNIVTGYEDMRAGKNMRGVVVF
jgi:NDMA-dependent alcohol dehydrogenase